MQPERLRCESPGQRPGPDLQHTSSPCKGDVMCGTQTHSVMPPFQGCRLAVLFPGLHIAAFQAAGTKSSRAAKN